MTDSFVPSSAADSTDSPSPENRCQNRTRDFERVQALFWKAVALPVEQRIAWAQQQDAPTKIVQQVIAALKVDLRGSQLSDSPSTANSDPQQPDPQQPDPHQPDHMFDQQTESGNQIAAHSEHGLRLIAGHRKLPTIPNYELLEEIDRGGMGIVYKARQFRPNRIVAIKMMRMGVFSSALDVERFFSEANSASQLAHAAVVPVYEVGEINGEPFLVMKFINGTTLHKLLQHNAISTTEAIQKLATVARAIADAHDHGIIHRDLKPSNILIDEGTGLPWVMDFGLAKNLQADLHLTSAGDIMGTPGYMAPEQATGQASTANPAADVYGLGAILYRILTGQPPVKTEDGDFARTMQLIREHDLLSPRERDRRIPGELDAICIKALQTDPAHRYQHARDLADDLQRYLDGESVEAKSSGLLSRLKRWARHRPGLAVTICTVFVFSVYHVLIILAGLLPGDESFKKTVAVVIPLAILNAATWQWCLQRTAGAAWTLYAWSTGEVLLLTATIFAGDGARSGLISALFVLVAASSLRCRPLLVGYVTVLTMLSYAGLWAHSNYGRDHAVGALTGIPVLLAIALIGLVQFVALNRSGASFESIGNPLSGKIKGNRL